MKGLAVYDANNSIKAFRKAVDDRNVVGVLMSTLSFVLDVAALFSSCFDGDTPVATETGFRRIDEVLYAEVTTASIVFIATKSKLNFVNFLAFFVAKSIDVQNLFCYT